MKLAIKKRKDYFLIIGIYLLMLIIVSGLNSIFMKEILSSVIIFILTIVLLFFLSFKTGKKRSNKGYLAGIKCFLIWLFIITIFDLLFIKLSYTPSRIIYYIILLIICITGSILGINKKAS